jgi:uncharacterized protein (DUF433 family)
MFVKLSREVSLRRIRKALSQLEDGDLADHPSAYRLITDGKSVFLVEEDGATDLLHQPGQRTLLTVEDAFAPFENRQGRRVADFRHPRPQLEVHEQRLQGWPTAIGTRVPYDSLAQLAIGGMTPAEVVRSYPSVTEQAVRDAEEFYWEVARVGGRPL